MPCPAHTTYGYVSSLALFPPSTETTLHGEPGTKIGPRPTPSHEEAILTAAVPSRAAQRLSPPKRDITSIIIQVPRRPTAGDNPARMANATAVGTAVSPVVIPASHSTRLSLNQVSISCHVLSRSWKEAGQPHERAHVYASSSKICKTYGSAHMARTTPVRMGQDQDNYKYYCTSIILSVILCASPVATIQL